MVSGARDVASGGGRVLDVTQLGGQGDGVARTGDGEVVFVPFAFVEAAANVLTNPALDPFGKIPEFKYAACRLSPA